MKYCECTKNAIVAIIFFLCGLCVAIISIKIGNASFIESIMLSLSLFWDSFVFKEWQTLVSSSMALTAALITVHRMKKNHDDLVYRKKESLRAYLHDALSELSGYCKECFWYIESIDTEKELPQISPDYINTLKNYIGYANESEVEDFRELIEFYQVFNSRLGELKQNIAMNKKENILYDVLKLNMMISSMFYIARVNNSDYRPDTLLEKMHNSFNSFIRDTKSYFYSDRANKIRKRIEERLLKEEAYKKK